MQCQAILKFNLKHWQESLGFTFLQSKFQIVVWVVLYCTVSLSRNNGEQSVTTQHRSISQLVPHRLERIEYKNLSTGWIFIAFLDKWIGEI